MYPLMNCLNPFDIYVATTRRKMMLPKKHGANWRRNVSGRKNANETRKFASKRSASPSEWTASGALHCFFFCFAADSIQRNKNVFTPPPSHSHDSNHWKTAPTWNDEPFCFCMNANNNTYSCVRTINQTHNFLYCEFTTGLVTFYNLRTGWYIVYSMRAGNGLAMYCTRDLHDIRFPIFTDPFETQNRVAFLSADERLQLHNTLEELKACRGRGCTLARYGISSDFVINAPRGIKRKHNATGEPIDSHFDFVIEQMLIFSSYHPPHPGMW